MHDSLFVNLPGSFNSSHHFARAAKLPSVGYIWEWPKFIQTSPLYAVAGQPSTNPSIISAMDVLNSVYLPKGMDDAGEGVVSCFWLWSQRGWGRSVPYP
jgi:hypothetical protein